MKKIIFLWGFSAIIALLVRILDPTTVACQPLTLEEILNANTGLKTVTKEITERAFTITIKILSEIPRGVVDDLTYVKTTKDVSKLIVKISEIDQTILRNRVEWREFRKQLKKARVFTKVREIADVWQENKTDPSRTFYEKTRILKKIIPWCEHVKNMVQENINVSNYAKANSGAGCRRGFIIPEEFNTPDHIEAGSRIGCGGDFNEESTYNKERRELRRREREEERKKRQKKPKWTPTDHEEYISRVSREDERIDEVQHHDHPESECRRGRDENNRDRENTSIRRECSTNRWRRGRDEDCEAEKIILKKDIAVFEEKTKLLTKEQKEFLQEYRTVIGLKQKDEAEFSAYVTIDRNAPTPVITEVGGIEKVKQYLEKKKIKPYLIEKIKVNPKTEIEKTFTASIFHNTNSYEYIEKQINIKVNPTEKSICFVPGSPPSTP